MWQTSRNLFLLIFGASGASGLTLSILLFGVLDRNTSTREDSPLLQGKYKGHLKIEEFVKSYGH
jgi:hypothetical protein